MNQLGFFDHNDEGDEEQFTPEAVAGTGPGVEPHGDWHERKAPRARLYVGIEDLCAAGPWGDLLRLVHTYSGDVRLVIGPALNQPLLLRNPANGTWRIQGAQGFEGLAAVMLAEANAEALEIIKADLMVEEQTKKKLAGYIQKTGGGSAGRALRLVPRLAADPTAQIPRVDASILNRVERCPILLAGDQVVGLSDGKILSSRDLREHYVLDLAPAPTSYVPDAATRDAPGTAMMLRFLAYLGNGDEEGLVQRLGWQLCGHHETLDVIAGDQRALRLLARILRETLGASGVHILSMDRGAIRPRDVAYGMRESRLCVWQGADTRASFPVWEVNDYVTQAEPLRQGNLLALVAEWAQDWNTLDHRIARTCGWAWRVQGLLEEQDIDVDVLLNQDGKECLLAMLVSGAVLSHQVRDPAEVAATSYSRVCAEEMRVAGASPIHRILYRLLQFTDDPDDRMTMTDISDAMIAIGEEPVDHALIGKELRKIWQGIEPDDRERIGREQVRVVRRVALRSQGGQ